MPRTYIDNHDGTFTFTCSECGQSSRLQLDRGALERWKGGELIQRAFPDLSADDRELMISGLCGACFDLLFDDRLERYDGYHQ